MSVAARGTALNPVFFQLSVLPPDPEATASPQREEGNSAALTLALSHGEEGKRPSPWANRAQRAMPLANALFTGRGEPQGLKRRLEARVGHVGERGDGEYPIIYLY